MISTTMKACQEYSSFVIDPSNRDISDTHVEKLEDAITDVYLLDAYPIVTTAERVIVDGQHRFKMAKSLGIPFYYIAGDGITIEDVALANANTERYTYADALHVYNQLGIKPYQYLTTFTGKYNRLPLTYVSTLLSSTAANGDFLKGAYSINRINYATGVISKLMDFANHKKEILNSRSYRRAIEILACSSLYDHKRMMERVAKVPTRLVPCGRYDEVLTLFTDEIYNYCIPSKNRVDLTTAHQYQKQIAEDTIIEGTIEAPKRGMVCSSNVQIFKESNLDKFRVHSSCRPLRGVGKLTESIKKRNLLQFYPIIVDRDFVVYDGQRRLEAARQVNVPIYYIVLQNVSLWMIARAGGLSKSWAIVDYIKHYATLGLPAYVRMARLMQRYTFLNAESFFYLGEINSHSGIARIMFKSGQWKIDDSMLEVLPFFDRIPLALAKKARVQRMICSLYRRYPTAYFLNRTQSILVKNESTFIFNNDFKTLSTDFIDLYNSGLSVSNRIENTE